MNECAGAGLSRTGTGSEQPNCRDDCSDGDSVRNPFLLDEKSTGDQESRGNENAVDGLGGNKAAVNSKKCQKARPATTMRSYKTKAKQLGNWDGSLTSYWRARLGSMAELE